MKVCIPIETKQQGGGFYFIENLRRYLDRQGVSHTQSIHERSDILFLNAWHVTPFQVAASWRANPGVRLVHRVDGAAQDYGRRDGVDRIQSRVSRWTDATIFQSHYCRYSTREKFRVITQDGPVIWNPVDVALFTPEGYRRELAGAIRVCYATYSTNPRKGAPELYQVAASHPDVDFYLCGRYENPPPLSNLHRMGVLARDDLAEVMRSCHVFLTFAQNEACPNVVLEAMASGVPVLYLDSGAAGELVQDTGLPVTVDTFAGQLQRIMADRRDLSRRARQRAEGVFHPDAVLPRYITVFEKVLALPPHVSVGRRRLVSQAVRLAEPVARGWDGARPFRRRVIGKLRTWWPKH